MSLSYFEHIRLAESEPKYVHGWIFPGQGGHQPGMGEELARSDSKIADLYDVAFQIVGYDFLEKSKQVDLAKRTDIAQPLIFTYNTACESLFSRMHKVHNPQVLAGHSLGQYNALVRSGALSFADALFLVTQRGIAMQQACEDNPSSKFVVLSRSPKELIALESELTKRGVYLGVANSPYQKVFGGRLPEVEEAKAFLATQNVKVIPLPVAGAFHTPLMESAILPMKRAMGEVTVKRPRTPVILNTTANIAETPNDIEKEIIAHLIKPVQWEQTMQVMDDLNVGQLLEFGNKSILTRMLGENSSLVTFSTVASKMNLQ